MLIVTYLLLNLSRLIVNFSNKKVTPWVYKITDKSSIVLKSTYDKLSEDRDRFQKRYELERAERYKVEEELEKVQNRVLELSEELSKLPTKLKSSDVSKNVPPLPNKNKMGEDVYKSEDLNKAKKIIAKINSKNYNSDFESLIFDIENNKTVSLTMAVKYFGTLGLITRTNESNVFKFTELGLMVMQYYRDYDMI